MSALELCRVFQTPGEIVLTWHFSEEKEDEFLLSQACDYLLTQQDAQRKKMQSLESLRRSLL